MAGKRPACDGALLLLLCLAPVRGSAHREVTPKQDRLELRTGEARVVLDYGVPAGEEARALRRLFDRDRSGALEAGEEASLGEHLARLATVFLVVSVDGRSLPLAREALEVALQGREADGLAVRLTLTAPAPLGRGPHRVRIEDRHKDRRVTVPLVVRLDGLVAEGPRLPPLSLLAADRPLDLRVRSP